MSRLGTKKGMYHSALSTYCEANGALPVVLTSTVSNSVKKELVGVVYFKIVGEDGQFETPEHYYNIENEAIKHQLASAPRDTVLQVLAGGRGKEAATHTMQITLPSGAQMPQPAATLPPQQPPPSTAAPQPPSDSEVPASPSVPPQQLQPAPAPQDHRPATLQRQAADCYVAAAEVVGGLINMKAFPFFNDATADMKLDVTARLAHTLMQEIDRQAGTRPLRMKKPKWVLQETEE